MRSMPAPVLFIAVFVYAFIFGGWFLMPYLPPSPGCFVSRLDLEYWAFNWAGALLGIVLSTAVVFLRGGKIAEEY